ncbi:MAG: gliding motility-associated C-terminal domain-containing protein [Bacteroidales bacterium]|nr:gliding motility-associated C-terminal domain-containing protein [Bacteroidales bacterium]
MKKVILVFSAFFFMANLALATHQRAAEITYRHIEGLTFEFTITMYTRTSSPADDTRTTMPVSWDDGSGDELPRIVFEEIPGVFDISLNIYKGLHTFPAPGTYTVSVEDPNRNNGVINIPNSVNVPMFIETSLTINPFLGYNNSVQLLNPPIDQGCVGKNFVHNPGAYDIDGDSLSYHLVVCKGGGGFDIPGYSYPKTSDIFSMNPVSGDLLWITPVLQGEYNVAFVIEEWRHGIKISSVRRDMQIEIVACDHDPPEIITIDDTCVLAGEFLQFDISAFDPDGTSVELTGFGGPFEQSTSPAYIQPDPAIGNDTVSTSFYWQTSCEHVRFEPYTAVFKAKDNGFPISLVNFKTVFIQVNAPAPENLQADALGNGINLSWGKSQCENAIGYKIYRRSGESGWEPGYCETGVPPYTGFRLIREVEGLNTLSFRDDNDGEGLVPGIQYCYRVTASFYDGAESFASNEACSRLKKDVPIITHVSNDSLNLNSGNVLVVWSKPTELDTITYPGPYKYILFRNDGFVWDAPEEVAQFNSLNDTIYLDKSVNLNTNARPYSYRVDMESGTVGFIGSSQKASSVFLRTEPTDGEVRLSWLFSVPWENAQYVIFRKGPEMTTFDAVGTSILPLYNDLDVTNEEEYCYYIKAIGHYSLSGLVDPLINFSQLVCDTPIDNVPPCQPLLTVEPDCEEVANELAIQMPDGEICDNNENCDCNASYFLIYYTPPGGQFLQLIDSIEVNDQDTITYYRHTGIESVVGCYSVSAVDSVGNVSNLSEIVCVGYDACPPYELPNVFTPNADDVNDLFIPKTGNTGNPKANVERVDMKIFNRWGKTMYTTEDPQINWDGKNQNNNTDCSEGVYYYVCEVYIVTLNGTEQFTIKGSVTLIRGR